VNRRWLYDEIAVPITRAVTHMRHMGVRLDLPRTTSVLEQKQKEAEEIAAEVTKRYSIDVGSPKQVGKVLYDHILGPGGGGPDDIPEVDPFMPSEPGTLSTRSAILEELENRYPLAALTIKHREAVTAVSRYCGPWLKFASVDGRLHPNWTWGSGGDAGDEGGGTISGRIGSRGGANLLNPPDWSRDLIIADEDCCFLVADYKQLEPRLIAALSRDPDLVNVFKNGEDFHSVTTRRIGRDPSVKENRDFGKRVNMAMLNDVGMRKLMRTGLKREAALEIVTVARAAYPGIAAMGTKVKFDIIKNGYVEGPLGLRLYCDMKAGDPAAELRRAVSFYIQSTGALITAYATVRTHQRFAEVGIWPGLSTQLHDSIGVIAPRDRAPEAARLLRKAMLEDLQPIVGPWMKDVPLAIDFKVGHTLRGGMRPRWLKEVEDEDA